MAVAEPVGSGPGEHRPLPEGWGLQLDRVARRPRPDLLIGGSPLRVLRLRAGGGRLLDRLVAGAPVPASAGAQRLARRLLDAGVAHPRPLAAAGGRAAQSVTVVIPVRDRPDGLAATLESLDHGVAVVVVDDASVDRARTDRAATSHPRAHVVHRAARGGPGAARQTGWQEAASEVVAFVDADCRPSTGWLDALLPLFDDPAVGAVAPRIVTPPGPATAVARYERTRSPLDMGRWPSPVRPGAPVPYVPTAALLVRRDALADVGGFDSRLHVGEDVDLVWRLDRAGWRVRYQPDVTVTHPVRASWPATLRQRWGYGTSATLLAQRHGAAVAPLDVSPWSAVSWAALVTGHPAAGATVAVAATMRLAASARLPALEVVRLAAVGHLRAGQAIAAAVRRPWWPLAAGVAAVSRRTRPALLAAAVLPPLVDWVRDRPGVGPLRWTAMYLADDMAYGAGVWAGVIHHRRAAALRPRWR